MTLLDSGVKGQKGQGHSKPLRWWMHPRRHWGIKVHLLWWKESLLSRMFFENEFTFCHPTKSLEALQGNQSADLNHGKSTSSLDPWTDFWVMGCWAVFDISHPMLIARLAFKYVRKNISKVQKSKWHSVLTCSLWLVIETGLLWITRWYVLCRMRVDPQFIKQLNESPSNRYSFVCSALVNICNCQTHNDRFRTD